MKMNFKWLLYLTFFSLTLIFIACELQEDAIKKDSHQQRLKMYNKEFDELLTNRKFANAISKLPKKKTKISSLATGKTVMEENYGFSFADKSILVIEEGEKVSYTFLISRDTVNESIFENLVIQSDSLEKTKAFIVKYTITSDLTKTDHGSWNFEYQNQFQAIIYDDSPYSKEWYETGCTYINTVTCCQASDGGPGYCHTATPFCLGADPKLQFLHNYTQEICWFGDGSGGGGVGDTSGGPVGGSGGGGSIHSDAINTGPVLPELVDGSDHCANMKKLTAANGANILPVLNPWETQVEPTNDDGREYGSSFKKSSAGVYTNSTIPNSNDLFLPIPSGADDSAIYGAVHTHPNDALSMFSWSDLFTLFRLYKEATVQNKPEVVFMMVCEDGVYALKIDNFDQFRRSMQDMLFNAPGADLKNKRNHLDRVFDEDTKKLAGVNDDLEFGFLNTLKKNNLAVSTYKLNTDTNTWTKLFLKPTGTKDNVVKDSSTCL